MLALLLGATLYSYGSFALLLLVILVGGMWEFYRLVESEELRPQRWLGITMGLLIFCASVNLFGGEPKSSSVLYYLSLALIVPFLMLIVELLMGRGELVRSVGTSLLGVIYVALPLSLLLGLPFMITTTGWEPWCVLFFIFIIWANDVFAYLSGILLGRHKMCPKISPKKSWEGFVGGVVGAVVMGYVASRVLAADALLWCGLALVAAITGVLGDLVESQLKRKAGVKDSGSIIPGHGGVLDRFDALLLATPFVVAYLLILKILS